MAQCLGAEALGKVGRSGPKIIFLLTGPRFFFTRSESNLVDNVVSVYVYHIML